MISSVRDRRFHEDFPVTSLLLLFNIAFFFLETIGTLRKLGDMSELEIMIPIDSVVTHVLGSISFDDLRRGEYWRLLSAAFLHGSAFHLLLNMVVLFDLGRFCEPFLSSWKFLTVYVASALGSSLAGAAYGWITNSPHRTSVGASGALAGMIGLLLVHSIRQRDTDMRDGLLRWILMILALSFIMPGIDHAGHAGGFVTGAVFGMSAPTYMTSRAASRWCWPAYAAGTMVLIALGFSAWSYFAS
jgi:rhomboid protease GluP